MLKNVDKNLKYCKVAFDISQNKTITVDGVDYFEFEGYASTFGNVDLDGDIIGQGAFKESLKEHSPSLLWQHDMGEPLGIFTSIKEDQKGLFVKGRMPIEDTLVKGRVIPQMRAGSVRAMSIGFSVQDYEYEKGTGTYTFTKVMLWEISLVTIPANPKAVVTDFKSLEDMVSLKEISAYLKNLGLSNKKCNIIISKVKSFARDEQDNASHSDYEGDVELLYENIMNLKTLEV